MKPRPHARPAGRPPFNAAALWRPPAGKSASGLKEVTDSFAEGMKEGNLQLDLKSAEEAVPAEAKEVEKPSSE